MGDTIDKEVRAFNILKRNVIIAIMKDETNDTIETDELKNFINFLNILMKNNKSKNSIDGRVLGLKKMIVDLYYQKFKEVDTIYNSR
jgi:hypothetical protein